MLTMCLILTWPYVRDSATPGFSSMHQTGSNLGTSFTQRALLKRQAGITMTNFGRWNQTGEKAGTCSERYIFSYALSQAVFYHFLSSKTCLPATAFLWVFWPSLLSFSIFSHIPSNMEQDHSQASAFSFSLFNCSQRLILESTDWPSMLDR